VIVALVVSGGAFALLVVCRLLLFQPFSMPSVSMQPTLERGDYFVVAKPPLAGSPGRGDIIVFKLPSSGHIDYIKRLVGLPGDRIQLKAGQLYINDRPTAETPLGTGTGDLPAGPGPVKLQQETMADGRSYEIELSPGLEPAGDTGVYAVPPHCYFVLGDNRDNSLDSRFDPGLSPGDPKLGGCGWNAALDDKVGEEAGVGFVPEADLVGRAQFVVFSLSGRPGRTFKVLH
jgi:signal peptidase I